MDATMSKQSYEEEIGALKKDNAELKKRVARLELFVDSTARERVGITIDELRDGIRKDMGVVLRPPIPEYGPV
jgi:hypothetical protein